MNTNIKYILIGVIVLLVAVAAWWFTQSKSSSTEDEVELRGVEGEPVDIALDFYEAWLRASKSTSTNPFPEVVNNSEALSVKLSERLLEIINNPTEDQVDPVLCQASLPEKFRVKTIFEKEETVQLMILAKDKESKGQAVVDLKAHDNLWEITDITCLFGETAPPQGEFSFDKEGQLLKSVPPPLNPDYWHLVFEENGQFGHTVPLLLDENSECTKANGEKSVCTEDMLTQTVTVRVQGDMEEAGLKVKKIQF